jgi:class 3 adenylate cyclase/tetratricopeptide (TPR) repeat protein
VDVERWLDEIGLAQYAELFRANDIDANILREMTAEDLKELGISSFGHRKRLVSAIAALTAEANRPVSVLDCGTAPARPAAEAERRQLTVLFCDLVGSTELSQRLDPEDLRDVMRRYQDTCAGVVARYEGIVAKFLGDGVLVYFGFPLAHEDDAERAVRAGLEMVAAVARVGTVDAPLAARVGIATGLVVVGDMGGGGEANAVAGETPNLAARLQAEASPGGVVIAPSTRRLTGDWFNYRELGNRALKGIADPVAIAQVLGERPAESRFAAIHASQLSPFVGREHELGLLLDRWRMAQDGEGQVVLLYGEAGIGKSRLAETLRERVGSADAIGVHYQCSPYHTSSALYPAIVQLLSAAGIEPEASVDEKLERLERIVGRPATPLLARLLAIPTDGRFPPLDLAPESQKSQTLQALADQLSALAGRQPVLCLVEDVHWIDPTTKELLDLVLPEISNQRVLMVVTARQEFRNPWSAYPHVNTLALNRLGHRHCVQLVAQLIEGGNITEELARHIVARAEGVPLFVEELTKSVLEAGDAYASGIPATLHDSLVARLDRLGSAKEAAQVGAAIGREFSYALIAAASDMKEPELRAALAALENAGLVLRRGEPPVSIYTFKHALVQDAAHDNMLLSRRKQLHARIVEVIKMQQPGLAVTQPELIALHYDEAGQVEAAARAWLTAGQLALSRSNNLEALAHLGRGTKAVSRTTPGQQRDSLEFDLQMGLASASFAVLGYGADETERAYQRAIELQAGLRQGPRLVAAEIGLYVVRYNRADLYGAVAIAEQALARAQQTDEPLAVCAGHRAVGACCLPMGRFRDAVDHAERALREHQRSGLDTAGDYAHDNRAAAFGTLMLAQSCLNDTAGAEWAMTQMLARSASVANRVTEAFADQFCAIRYLVEREFSRASEVAERFVSLADQHHMQGYAAIARCLLGAALAGLDPERALVVLAEAKELRAKLRSESFNTMFLCFEAEALCWLGRYDAARSVLARCERHAALSGERWWDAEILRTRAGVIRAVGGENADVREELERAIAAASAQGGEIFRRRAASEFDAERDRPI